MKKLSLIWMLALPFFMLQACGTTGQAGDGEQEEAREETVRTDDCLNEGRVRDRQTRLGCGYMIVDRSGRLLSVTNWNEVRWDPFNLDRIYFDYEYSGDALGSVCVDASATIRITCLEPRR